MKKIFLVLGLFLLFPHLAEAQSQRNPCAYLGTNSAASLQGNCLAIGYYLAGANGVPMPVGGVANASAPVFTEGKPGYLSFDLSGNLRTTSASGTSSVIGSVPNVASGTVAPTSTNIGAAAYNYASDGTTWDPLRVDSNFNLLVSSGGAPSFSTSQVSVGLTSTSVCAARAGRRACTITAITGAQQIFCSGTVATTANGQLVPAVVGASFTVNTTAAINCITTVGAQTVSVAETF